MHVFVTGGTGFIGSAVVAELLRAGHEVTGLARSDAAADVLQRAGARVHRGSLQDTLSLRHGVSSAEGVIHCAFQHDLERFMETIGEHSAVETAAIAAIGDELSGSDRPFLVTGGTALVAPGQEATEAMMPDPNLPFPRRVDFVAAELAATGVQTSILRMPPSVHGEGDRGFVPRLIATARERGVSGYVGDGASRWPSVHRLDAAVLYRLVLEQGHPAGSRFHAAAEHGVATRDIAERIGRHLGLPARSEAAESFGWIGTFLGLDVPASSEATRAATGWTPAQPGLLDDLDAGHYFASSPVAS